MSTPSTATALAPDEAERLGETLRAADATRPALSRIPAYERSRVLRTVADRIRGDADDLAISIVTEGVKTIGEARVEVVRAATTFDIAAEEALRPTGRAIAFDAIPGAETRWGTFERRPIGLVAAITPYNDPLNLVAHKLAPAIACGAAIVLKPHERTPGPARRLFAYVAAAGWPAGAATLLECGHASTLALVADPRVRIVSFTGGRRAAAAIARAAGPKAFLMELGGVGASYVHADADVSRAAARLASGIVWAGGQNCVHTQHVLAHESITSDLSARLLERLARIRLGDRMDPSTEMARQIDRAAAERLERLVDDALACGARELLRVRSADPEVVGPCVLTDVPAHHPVSCEEVFGPIAALASVSGLDEALARVTSLGPAINSSIFTDSLATMRRWEQAVDAGCVVVNESTDFRTDNMPFGGNGAAGIGREGVAHAMEAMTAPRVVAYCV